METITITFGDVCENHVGNQQDVKGVKCSLEDDINISLDDMLARLKLYEGEKMTRSIHSRLKTRYVI